MWNREFWHRDWPAFCRFFFSQCFTEPDSEEQIEHFLSMGLETSPEVIAATIDAKGISEETAREAAMTVRVPTLVIHGDEDAISSVESGRELARLSGAELVVLPGSGHEPHCRIPSQVNGLLDAFLSRHYPSWFGGVGRRSARADGLSVTRSADRPFRPPRRRLPQTWQLVGNSCRGAVGEHASGLARPARAARATFSRVWLRSWACSRWSLLLARCAFRRDGHAAWTRRRDNMMGGGLHERRI